MLTLLLSAALVAATPVLREDNIPEIVSMMTLEEKAAIVVGGASRAFDGIGRDCDPVKGSAGNTHAIPRLGIPFIVLADGPAGLRINPTREGDEKTYYCTGFPIGTMLSSTWNTDLVEEVGRAMGNEVLEYGVDVLLGPGINIHRNPLCGRNFEYYSEDPLLAGEMAAAMVSGIQSNGVGACIKHFALNNQELNRLHNDALVSERAMREIYLKPFEIAVRKAQPWTIMTSYNYINGIHASESPDLLTAILRDTWGFEGTVMTDWGGGYDTAAQVHAGNDMVQSGSDRRYFELIDAVKEGRLEVADLDKCVARVLKLIVKSPRYKGYAYSNDPDLTAHAAVCRKAADEGVILLKNRKALPYKGNVALFGVTSYRFIAGGTGSGDVHRPYVVDLKQGLSDEGYELYAPLDGFYTEYMKDEDWRCRMIDGNNSWVIDRERPIEIVPMDLIASSAKEAGEAVITFGRVFGEGKDRDLYHSYMLQSRERELLEAVSSAFHKEGKKVVVILNIGGAVETASWRDLADAIVLAWQPGEEGGHTVASVLSGAVNPSGRLPMTLSMRYEDEPSAPNFPLIYADKPFNYSFYRRLENNRKDMSVKDIDYTEYKEDIFVGYRWFNTFAKKKIAWPFGFGLSYTSFRWSGMKVKETSDGWEVTLTVKNTGKMAGKDVVELYVSAPGKDMEKPKRELKGFAKTSLLDPGCSETVTILLPSGSLASYDEDSATWVTEKGRYTLSAARNASDRGIRKRIRI
ncbi:MAG: glycoside hydrolase family 3 protein [Bacteroidales bacterium]|nr:glycoside hydrolase family 3 protein [Bacteroidales bacterium]